MKPRPIPQVVFRHWNPATEPEYIEMIGRDCGCRYERWTEGLRRYTARCEPHEVMCRDLEDWEIDDK